MENGKKPVFVVSRSKAVGESDQILWGGRWATVASALDPRLTWDVFWV